MPIVRIYTSSGPWPGGGGFHGGIVNERFIRRTVGIYCRRFLFAPSQWVRYGLEGRYERYRQFLIDEKSLSA